MGYEEMRRPYGYGRLERDDLDDDPTATLGRWLADAAGADQIEPNAMSLATVGPDGRPSSRMVLLKGLDDRGLVFFTNHGSRKGRDLAANPVAAATFWWDRLQRQVRVEGRVERLDDEESRAYFASRPYGSRLGAWASPQSEPIEARDVLEARVAELRARHPEGSDVPKPPFWGGYRIVPDRVELWQGREDRLHDRFAYELRDGAWRVTRLAP